jgi:hypothetical protein
MRIARLADVPKSQRSERPPELQLSGGYFFPTQLIPIKKAAASYMNRSRASRVSSGSTAPPGRSWRGNKRFGVSRIFELLKRHQAFSQSGAGK